MKQYRYEMHLHTSNVSPCGKVEAAEVVRRYAAVGYRGIVMTDHYYEGYFLGLTNLTWEEKIKHFLSGYEVARATGESVGLVVLLGMELRFEDHPNDYLVYGITEEFLIQYPEIYYMDLLEFRKLAKQHNLLIYQAHPFRMGMTHVEPSLLDGIEVFNGNPRHNSRNHLAERLARKNSLKMISGTDFHQRGDEGRGGIIVTQEITTNEALVSYLKNSPCLELYIFQ